MEEEDIATNMYIQLILPAWAENYASTTIFQERKKTVLA